MTLFISSQCRKIAKNPEIRGCEVFFFFLIIYCSIPWYTVLPLSQIHQDNHVTKLIREDIQHIYRLQIITDCRLHNVISGDFGFIVFSLLRVFRVQCPYISEVVHLKV